MGIPRDMNFVIDHFGKCLCDSSPLLSGRTCEHGGFYLTKYGRTMTVNEICRLQGIRDGVFDYKKAGIKRGEFLGLVGDAMNAAVLARILERALLKAGITRILPPREPTADNLFQLIAPPPVIDY
jgi:hypothetical protein